MATDYDEVRSTSRRSQDSSLEALKSASAPDARSVVTELDEADALDEALTPGGRNRLRGTRRSGDPQGKDECTRYSVLLVRHRSQLARENGHSHCIRVRGQGQILRGRPSARDLVRPVS